MVNKGSVEIRGDILLMLHRGCIKPIEILRITNISNITIKKHLKHLVKLGFVDEIVHPERGITSSRKTYHITPEGNAIIPQYRYLKIALRKELDDWF